MSQAKHTPGRWYAAEWTCRAASTVLVDDPPSLVGKRMVADCESEAAALLIAAAPELLEALRAIVETCDDPQGSDSGESLACAMARLLPAARAAIAKATRGAA